MYYCGATTPAALLADAEGGNDNGRLFLSPNKTGEACASPVVKVSELRLWWTAYPPRPFPTSPGSAFVLPFGCQSRVSHPPFFIDAFASISRDRRLPLEPPLWYDRFFWQNPVRVTRPVTTWALPFSSTLRPCGWWVSSNGEAKLLL